MTEITTFKIMCVVAVLALFAALSIQAETQATSPAQQDLGPELLSNGDFEDAFVDGVAKAWIGHPGPAKGYFGENPKTGRIGGGLYGATRCWNGPCEEDVQTLAMSGKVHVVDLSRMDMTSKIRQKMGPDAIVVLRLYVGIWESSQPRKIFEGDIEANGAAFANYCYNKSRSTGHWPRCFHGLHEPNLNDPDALAQACRFELGFTRRLHEVGCRSCALNHSPGTPVPKENMYSKEVRELLAVADYVGYHSYGGPDKELMCAESGRENDALLWREFAKEYSKRGWRFPPVIYTEGTTRRGWIDRGDKFTPEMIRDDLLGFEELMRADPWAVGLCTYLTGTWPGQQRQTWDISKYPERIIEPVRQRNRAHPIDAHAGTCAQVIGGNGEPVDRCICQSVITRPGGRYRFCGWFKFEFFDGQGQPLGHKAAIQVGFDPTGQTDNAAAGSIKWSANLVGAVIRETDIYYRYAAEFQAGGEASSIWLRLAHAQPKPSTRLCVDDLSLREMQ